MSNSRILLNLHDKDYFSYENRIYQIDWSLKKPNNVIRVCTGEPCYIDEYNTVKWLRNYKNLTVIK